MFDAQSPVCRAVFLLESFEHVENSPVRAIANCMHCELQAGFVRSLHLLIHFIGMQKLGTWNSAGVWSIRVRLVEPRRRRSEGAVRKSLQSSDLDFLRSEVSAHSRCRKTLPIGQRDVRRDA